MNRQEELDVILDQMKTDYINKKSVGIDSMIERHGYDQDLTEETMRKFMPWAIEREKQKKRTIPLMDEKTKELHEANKG